MRTAARAKWTTTVLSMMAAACYLLGSIAFLWDGLFKAGVVLFIVGSSSFVAATTSEALARHRTP